MSPMIGGMDRTDIDGGIGPVTARQARRTVALLAVVLVSLLPSPGAWVDAGAAHETISRPTSYHAVVGKVASDGTLEEGFEVVVEATTFYAPASGNDSHVTLHRHGLWLNPLAGGPRGEVPVYLPWAASGCTDLGASPEEMCLYPDEGRAPLKTRILDDGQAANATLVGGAGCIHYSDSLGVARTVRLPGLVMAPLVPGGACPP